MTPTPKTLINHSLINPLLHDPYTANPFPTTQTQTQTIEKRLTPRTPLDRYDLILSFTDPKAEHLFFQWILFTRYEILRPLRLYNVASHFVQQRSCNMLLCTPSICTAKILHSFNLLRSFGVSPTTSA